MAEDKNGLGRFSSASSAIFHCDRILSRADGLADGCEPGERQNVKEVVCLSACVLGKGVW